MKRTLLTVCLLVAALFCTAALLSRADSAGEISLKYMAAIAAPFLWAATFWVWKAGEDQKEVATHVASPVVECVLIFLVAGAISLWIVQMEQSRTVTPKFKPMKVLPTSLLDSPRQKLYI